MWLHMAAQASLTSVQANARLFHDVVTNVRTKSQPLSQPLLLCMLLTLARDVAAPHRGCKTRADLGIYFVILVSRD